MNGYKVLADSHRKAAAETKSETERRQMEEQAKVLDIVGDLTDRERGLLFDTGAFNDIVQGYVRMMFDSWDAAEDDIKEDAADDLRKLFDTVKAKDAAAYFKGKAFPLDKTNSVIWKDGEKDNAFPLDKVNIVKWEE